MSFLINYKIFEDDVYIPLNNQDFQNKYNNKYKIKVNIFARCLKFLSMSGSMNLFNKGVPNKIKMNKGLLYSIGSCNNDDVLQKVYPGIPCKIDDIKKPKFIEYVWNKDYFDGLTIFLDTDMGCVSNCNSKYKVCCLMESKFINSEIYKMIIKFEKKFDLILTHNKDILDKYPNKSFYIPASTCMLDWKEICIFQKSKLISFATSSKLSGLEGYKIRGQIKNYIENKKFNKEIDTFGSGFNKPFIGKSICLKDYMFSICLENSKYDFYMTEKIFDVILSGCIPIYWGMPSINEIFDERGIITFNNVEELKEIIDNLTEEKYNDMLPYVEKNFNIAKKFIDWDDNIVKSIYQKLDIKLNY